MALVQHINFQLILQIFLLILPFQPFQPFQPLMEIMLNSTVWPNGNSFNADFAKF